MTCLSQLALSDVKATIRCTGHLVYCRIEISVYLTYTPQLLCLAFIIGIQVCCHYCRYVFHGANLPLLKSGTHSKTTFWAKLKIVILVRSWFLSLKSVVIRKHESIVSFVVHKNEVSCYPFISLTFQTFQVKYTMLRAFAKKACSAWINECFAILLE